MSNVAYYQDESGKVRGPFSLTDLRRLAAEGAIRSSTLIGCHKDGKWYMAAQIKGLFANGVPRVERSVAAEPRPETPSAVLSESPTEWRASQEKAGVCNQAEQHQAAAKGWHSGWDYAAGVCNQAEQRQAEQEWIVRASQEKAGVCNLWRWLLKCLPWGLRNLGKYEKWSETDCTGRRLDCYRFLEDCDCRLENGEEKNLLSGILRPKGILKTRPSYSGFWLGHSREFDAEIDGSVVWWEDGPLTVPHAIHALAKMDIDHLMFAVVYFGKVLDPEEAWLVAQEPLFAADKKKLYIERYKK